MPLLASRAGPSICVRRPAFERAALTRAVADAELGLGPDDFRVEGELVVIGPIFGDAVEKAIELFETAGLAHFTDFFELTGNWPEWLNLYAMHARGN
jgi:hypothetical protein